MPAKSELTSRASVTRNDSRLHVAAITSQSTNSAPSLSTGLATRKVNATPSGVRTRTVCTRSRLMARPLSRPRQIPQQRRALHQAEADLHHVGQHRFMVLGKERLDHA